MNGVLSGMILFLGEESPSHLINLYSRRGYLADERLLLSIVMSIY